MSVVRLSGSRVVGALARPAARCVLMPLALILLIVVPGVGLAGTYYARPPYNVGFWWPNDEWSFSLRNEGTALQAVLLKGSGETERAGLIIKGYPLGRLDDPDALILFHWLMESEYRSGTVGFARLAGPYGQRVGKAAGYRTEMQHVLQGHTVRGSIVSFAHKDVFYVLILVALSTEYEQVNAEFEEMLRRIEFFESPHPLVPYVPPNLLGLKIAIRELVWPRETRGVRFVAPQAVGYGTDGTQSVFLRVQEELDPSTASGKPPTIVAEAAKEFEKVLGPIVWHRSTSSVYRTPVQCWDAHIDRGAMQSYLGLASWAVEKRTYLLQVLGPIETVSRSNLMEAVGAVLKVGVR